MMHDFLELLVRANVAASSAIVAVLILRRPVRQRFGAGAAYLLWATAPIAALACTSPPLPASIVAPATQIAPESIRAALSWGAGLSPSASSMPAVFGFWCLGVAVSLCVVAVRQRRFNNLAKAGAVGPAVLGLFFPKMVVPADFEAKYTSDERRVILAHERVHLARHDAPINALITLGQCVCWFNPLVHVAAFYARLDQELACDSDVMRRFPNDRRTYAGAMLKTHLGSASAPFGCHWPSRSSHPLEERIAMLSKPQPGRGWRLAGAALAGVLCLGTAYVAWGREGGQQQTPTVQAASAGLSLRWVDDGDAAATRAGNERVSSPDGDLWLEPDVLMSGDMVASATSMTDRDGLSVVSFQLTPEGRARFAVLTKANIGRRLAILINGKVVFAPVIRAEISEGVGQITGRGWSAKEAEALAAAIRPRG